MKTRKDFFFLTVQLVTYVNIIEILDFSFLTISKENTIAQIELQISFFVSVLFLKGKDDKTIGTNKLIVIIKS